MNPVLQTWKNRWFVLQKNELKYFKDPSSRAPQGVIDLNECLECELDEETYPDKQNMFRYCEE